MLDKLILISIIEEFFRIFSMKSQRGNMIKTLDFNSRLIAPRMLVFQMPLFILIL